MQKSKQNQATRAHRRVGTSTTLNRKYVQRPQRGTQALEDSVEAAAQAEALAEAQEQVREMREQKKAQKQIIQIEQPEEAQEQEQPALARQQEEQQAQQQVLQVEQQGAQEIEAASAQQSAKIQHFNRPVVKTVRTIDVTDESDAQAETAQQGAQLEQEIRAEQQVLAEQQMQGGQALVPATGAMHPLQAAAMARMKQQKTKKPKLTAKQIKDREIKKALATSSKAIDKDVAAKERAQKRSKMHFGIARVMLAISCTAAAVLAIVYFVGTNMPDISMRVAAMQTGIRASYPGYVPRGYNMTDLSSADGKVVMNFRNDEEDASFTLAEENSSWDSNALLTNYVKPEFGEDKYTIVREQGLTIYTSDEGAAWVNGGVVFKLTVNSGSLTKKQIRSIAVSL